MKKQDKWMLVDTGGSLYLYAADIEARLRSEASYRYTPPPETARPLSKADCIALAKALLAHA